MDVPYQKAKLNLADLIGRPYKVGGRGPADYDCWGLCMTIAAAVASPLPELAIPEDQDLRAALVQRQRHRGFVRQAKPRGGDLVLFRIIDDAGLVKWHIGTVLPDGRHFIHTTEKLGVHIASLQRQPWRLFVEGFYRYRP